MGKCTGILCQADVKEKAGKQIRIKWTQEAETKETLPGCLLVTSPGPIFLHDRLLVSALTTKSPLCFASGPQGCFCYLLITESCPGRVAQLVRLSSQYAKDENSIARQGTYTKQLLDASMSGTIN